MDRFQCWCGVFRGQGCNLSDDGNGNGFDLEGRRVSEFPCGEGALEAKVNLVCRVEAWVVAPQIEERLGNVPYVIFSRLSPEGIAADCKFSTVNLLCKDL